MESRAPWWLASLACFVGVACQGNLVDTSSQPSSSSGAAPIAPPGFAGSSAPNMQVTAGAGSSAVPNVSAAGSGAEACAPRAPQRLVLLSDFQYVSALRSQLGVDAVVGEELPNRQLKPFAQKGLVVNTSLIHTRGEWASQAAAKLSASATKKNGCDTITATCAESFLRTFLARAFRRPVDEVELTDLLEVYTLGAKQDGLHGLQLAVEAALNAPSFTYRRELGTIAAGQDVAQLDDYELASVLSFALSDAPPDESLWQAAVQGALHDPAQVRAQVTRMLELPAVQESLTSTLMAAWGVGNVFGAAKDPVLFPTFTPQLQASMYHETELLVGDVLWTRDAPINELLSTTSSFVDASLAELYGVPAPKGAPNEFLPATLPAGERAGLLTQASVLAMLARSDTTSVVARGLFVRGLLCMPKVPSPPESLTGEISALLMQDLTERQRADVRAANTTCAGCHVGIDPFGLLLEDYDPLGRHRTVLAGKPIDTHVTVSGTASYSGTHTDAREFLRTVAGGTDFVTCTAARTLSYALQDDALSPRDCQVKAALADMPPESLGMRDLVLKMLTSPSLRAREKGML